MTVYEEEVEVRRPSGVGTKVLVLACAILAVLGSFWGIVWFIRAYVEPPRVMMPAPLVLAARESVPAPAPPPPRRGAAGRDRARPRPHGATAGDRSAGRARPARARMRRRPRARTPANAVRHDRGPLERDGPVRASRRTAASSGAAAAPVESAPAALATSAPDPDEVVEGSVPAIEGPAPLPRRKPIVTAARRSADPPLPRPRPDGAAQPSVWTAVPTTDDRFPEQ